jgi:hypothetical protein
MFIIRGGDNAKFSTYVEDALSTVMASESIRVAGLAEGDEEDTNMDVDESQVSAVYERSAWSMPGK